MKKTGRILHDPEAEMPSGYYDSDENPMSVFQARGKGLITTDKKNLLVIKTTKRFIDTITVDISDEACSPFGFTHKEIAILPDGEEAIVMGVAPGNDGEKVLWYIIQHSATYGKACYWGGGKYLLEEGFKKKAT